MKLSAGKGESGEREEDLCCLYDPLKSGFKYLMTACLLVILSTPAKADHWWYVNSLQIVEDPVGSDVYRIDYTFTVNFQTVERFYWELFVVESGCNASDGFTASFSGCTLQGNLADGDYSGTLASGIQLCPGKSYDAIMYTRRRGDCTGDSTGGSGGPNPPSCSSAAPTNCGDSTCGCPEDRANVATPLGLLTKYPSIDTLAGDPDNIWDGMPLNALGDTPTFDGNWAYIRTTLTGNGVPDYDFMVNIDIDDCFGDFDQNFSADETDGQSVNEDFGGQVARVRCGASVAVTYNASNNCGDGYPGNTFEVIDNSTIGGTNIGSANIDISGPGVNVDGRFENLNGAIAVGNICMDGEIDLTLINASCSNEEVTNVNVNYGIEVMYPSSIFEAPMRVNCSDVCGQELIISGGAQWNPDGVNMGTATTMPVTDDPNGLLSFDWTGQVCAPTVSADACDTGSGSVKADNCASCGIYDITYAITNDSCSVCDAVTTQQIEVVSAVIDDVVSDVTIACDEINPNLTFEVYECNPVDGSATGTLYTGVGNKMWERSDNPGVYLPYSSPGSVAPGETVTFTPHWRYDGCTSCNAAGMPITVESIGELDILCPTANDLGEYDCTNLATIPALPTTQAQVEADPYNIMINDACGTPVIMAMDDMTPDACTATDQIITRSITIIDDQDGSGTLTGSERQQVCTYVYTIKATFVSPSFVGLPGDVTITCDAPPSTTTLAYDNGQTVDCASSGSVTSTLTPYPGICGGMITETWTIPSSANCDRGDIAETRMITVTPPDPPQIVCPTDETVSCAADIAAGTPTIITSCGATSSFEASAPVLVSGDADCPGAMYQITYVATDECGSSVSCTQTFTIANDPPTITCPADETVECASKITVGSPTITTACNLGESLSTTGPTLVSGSADCPGAQYEIVYNLQDDCGRMASCTQTFTIANDPPVITCPADETVQCAGNITAGTPTVVTSCGLASNVVTEGPTLVSGDADCPGAIYEITYTASDACGRSAMCTQQFTISNAGPTISAPADQTVACNSDIMAGTATTSTSCTLGSSVATMGPTLATGSEDCPGATYTITYTVTDDCGRTASDVQTFTIQNAAPTITCPDDMTVECSDDIVIGTPTTTSSCNLTTTVTNTTPSLVSGSADCPGAKYEVVYTVEDGCGRTASCTQTFTIDNDPPTITCPADMTVECAANIAAGSATMTSSCSLGTSISNSAPVLLSGTADCPGAVYEIVYTGQDDCGREVSCSQRFTIQNMQPDLTCPSDQTVECLADIAPGTPTFTSVCGISTSPFTTVGPTLVSGMDDCDGAQYEIVYSTTDDCGRTLTCTQTFTLSNAAPMITGSPADETIMCQGDIMANAAAITYTTSCTSTASVATGAIVADLGNSTCGDAAGDMYTITYTVEDNCGRTDTHTQTFTVDPSAPDIMCAPEMIITGCSADDAPAPDPSIVMATDMCSAATVTFVEDTQTGTGCIGDTLVITRIYEVTNACGVAIQCSQLIKIVDDEAPSITLSSTMLAADCGTDPPFPTVTVNDNCTTDPTVTLREDKTPLGTACVGDTLLVRTWIVTDDCNNQDSAKQEVFISNNSIPSLTAPADTTVQCIDQVPEAPILNATDACTTAPVVTFSESAVDGCPGERTITRTWEANNGCNTFSVSQTIHVIDTIKPVITTCAPEEVITGCDLSAAPAPDVSLITATDGCSAVTITHQGDTNIGGGCIGDTLIISRVYRATDECGNFSECTQLIKILDDELPTITCPAEITVTGCIAMDAPAVDITSITVSDNCTASPTVIHVGDMASGTPCPGDTIMVIRTYRATDDCGNYSECTQLIKIVDDVDPVITFCPADATVKCAADIPAAAPDDVIATDNCGMPMSATLLSTVDNTGAGCPGDVFTRTYTYEVQDACGNTTTCSQVISVIDDIAPIITSCPADMTVKCMADIPTATPMDVVATDNCGMPMSATLLSTADNTGAGCPGDAFTRTYTYEVQDPCGNATTCEQVITVINDVQPTITSCPADGTAQCVSEIPAAAPQDVVATDHCGASIMATLMATNNSGTGCSSDPYIRVYTYEVVDACSNTTTCTQTYTVIDDTPPVITSCPADGTAQCISEIPAADPSLVTATDNCEVVNAATLLSTVNEGTGCSADPYTRVYTYEITDACGNATTCTQTYTIIDDTPPVITDSPADMTVHCQSEIPGPDPLSVVAMDNCGVINPATVLSTVDDTGAGCLGDPFVRTYTYEVTDACGNASTVDQVITVVDDTLPMITSCPPDMTVSCIADIPAANPMAVIASDNCVAVNDATVLSTLDNTGIGCASDPFTRTYTYEVTDACGNSTTCQQIITVIDDEVPVMITCPADMTVDCVEEVPAANPSGVTGMDNCLTLNDATLLSTTDNGGAGCTADPLIITYTYELTDACGNAATCQQNITVIDDVAPVITTCPADITVKCVAQITAATPMEVIATSNCIETSNVTLFSTADNGGAGCANDPFVTTYTYQVTDLCGNATTCQQQMTVIDDVAPVITSCPSDMTVSCIEEIPAATPEAVTGTDGCGVVNPATLLNTSNNGGAGCDGDPYILTYTYQLTDACGNNTTCQQVITVIDKIAPVITSYPEDGAAPCISEIPAADPSLVTATDNCNEVNDATLLSTNESGTGCVGDPFVRVYTYQVTDLCGNATTCTQTFTVIDDTPPVINSCPTGATYQCIADIPAPTPLSVSASDNCGVTQTPTLLSTDNNGGAGCMSDPYVLTYTYEVQDACGNATTCTQTFTVIDDIAPMISSCPDDGTVQCIGEIPPAMPSAIMANDNCGVVLPATLLNTENSGTGCVSDPYTRVYTYEVQDACGNTVTCTQTWTVIDDTPPVITASPSNEVAQCIADIPGPNPSAVSGTDNCGVVQDATTIATENNGGAGCAGDPYILTYSYELKDACGNADTVTQSYTVEDVSAPAITCPEDQLIIGCSVDDIPDPDTSTVIISDNCINPTVMFVGDDTSGSGCPGDTLVVVRTYRVTDACGTFLECAQTFKLVDNIAPVITGVSDMTVDCDQDVTTLFDAWIDNNGGGSATDNCNDINWSTVPTTPIVSDISMPTCISFVATDNCGNSTTAEACFYIHCSEIEKELVRNLDQDNSGDIGAGDSLEYRVTYTNTGSTTLTNVVVSDDLIDPNTKTCASVAPGDMCILTGYYVVTPADIAAGSIDNTGDGTSDQRDQLTDVFSVALGMPSMAIEKSTPTIVNDNDESLDMSAGDVISYTITVTNNGTANLTDVMILDPMISPPSTTCTLLRPGENCTLVGTYEVTSSDVADGVISNSATASSDQTESISDDVTIELLQPDMTIKKSQPTNSDGDNSGDISVGDTLTYTVTVTNTGVANLTNVDIEDNTIEQIGGTQPCALLTSGESCTVIGIYVITEEDVSGTMINEITNVATATSDQIGPIEDDTTIEIPNPSLDVTKSAATLTSDNDNSGDLSLGDVLTYEIVLTNNGNANLIGVTIEDQELDPSFHLCGDLARGESCTLIGTHEVDEGDLANGMLRNIAIGSSQIPVIEDIRDTSDVLVPQPAHTMSKSSPILTKDNDNSGDPSAGDVISYTITLTNTGSANLTNAVVTDNLIDPSTQQCPLVEPGGTCILEGTYVVQQGDLGTTLMNSATTDTDQTEEQEEDADIIIPFPSMELEKSEAILISDNDGDGLLTTDDVVQYMVTVRNTGTANLTDVIITDDLIDPPTTTCTLLPPMAACTLAGTYTLTQEDLNAGMIMNQARASSDQTEDQDVKVITDLPYRPELMFEKNLIDISVSQGVHDDQIDVGDIITYEYVVSNTGLQTMTDIVVNDDGPTFNGMPGTGSLTPIDCPLATLQPRQSMTCTATYIITQEDFDNGLGRMDGVRNTANTTALEPNGDPYVSADDNATGEIPETPSIELIKTATDIIDINGDGIQWAGDRIDYTFTVINTGNSSLDNVMIEDDRIIDPIVCEQTGLEPGESTTCRASYIVTIEDAESGLIVNTATVFGTSQLGTDVSDISDDPRNPATSTSDPTVVVVPCPSIGCPAEFNISLSATEPFEVTPEVLGLPSGFVIGLTDENGDAIPGNIIDCSFSGFNLTYTAQHPCRPTACWGIVNIESKGLPEEISSRDTIYCGLTPSYPSLDQVIQDIYDVGCFARIDNVTEQHETVGDACTGQYDVRTVIGQSNIDGVKSDIIIRRDTTDYKIFDFDEVICPKSVEFDESLNFVCRQTQKFPDMTPSNVFLMTQRSYARTYPHIDTRELIEFFDTTTVIDSIVEVPIDTSILVEGLWVQTQIIRKDTFARQRIIRDFRKVLIPLIEGVTCNFSVKYTDINYAGCLGDTTSILRTWQILDWCTGQAKNCEQWIRIFDDTPPAVEELDDDVASIDPWTCEATYQLPTLYINEDCTTAHYQWSTTAGVIDHDKEVLSAISIELSPITLTATIGDDCGNYTTRSFELTLLDSIAPVASARDELHVSLAYDPTDDSGVAKVYADDINLDSHDGTCGTVTSCVLLDEELASPIIRNNVYLTDEDGNQLYHPSGCHYDGIYAYTIRVDKSDVTENIPYVICKDFVKFCCDDVGTHKVALVVSDASPYSQDAYSWTRVTVEDKSAPTITCQEYHVDCGDDIRPEVLGFPSVQSAICSTGSLSYEDDTTIDNCGAGVVTRTWYLGNQVTCEEYIHINADNSFDPYTIKWPKHYTDEDFTGVRRECELWLDDELQPVLDADGNEQYRIVEYEEEVAMGAAFTCSSEIETGAPSWCPSGCGVVGANSEILEVDAGESCKKVIRRWTIIDWCTWEENTNYIDDDNDTGLDQYQAVDDTWLDADDDAAAGLWLTDYRARSTEAIYNYPDGGLVTDLLCTTCPNRNQPADHVYFRYTTVDRDGYYTFDQVIKINDETDPIIDVDQVVEVSVFGGATSKEDSYEDCVSTYQLRAVGRDYCDNVLQDLSRLTWTVYVLDASGSPVSPQQVIHGDTAKILVPETPAGEERLVVWTLEDGCGNTTSTRSTIKFVDRKPPTPICIQDLSTTFMQANGSVTIWAKEYDRGSFDNCGPADVMFRDDSGRLVPALEFDCDILTNGRTAEIDLYLYAVDAAGNVDSCNISIRIDDQSDVCPDVGATVVSLISGYISTEQGMTVAGTEVRLADHNQPIMTSENGRYAFADLPMYEDYIISAYKNDDTKEGLTVTDLLLIQRHILGQQTFESPYLYIAGDVNNDRRVSVLDMVELRRLLLGHTDQFARNTSWRFIDPSQEFVRDDHPWPFNEAIEVPFLSKDMYDQNLMGIKIGDINGSISASDNRSLDLASMIMKDRLFEKGEIVDVAFYAPKHVHAISAMSFTLSHVGLRYIGAISANMTITGEQVNIRDGELAFVGTAAEQAATEMLYLLRFEAVNNGRLSESLDLTGTIVSNTAVSSSGTEYDLSLEFETANIDGHEVLLFQNEPNPFDEVTMIEYYLPEDADVEFTFYDVSGKLLLQKKSEERAGRHQLTIQESELNTDGVIYYQLTVGDETLSKKMIRIN